MDACRLEYVRGPQPASPQDGSTPGIGEWKQGTTGRLQLPGEERKKTSLIDIHCVFYRESFPPCYEAPRKPLPDAKKKIQAPFSRISWAQEPWARQTSVLHKLLGLVFCYSNGK